MERLRVNWTMALFKEVKPFYFWILKGYKLQEFEVGTPWLGSIKIGFYT